MFKLTKFQLSSFGSVIYPLITYKIDEGKKKQCEISCTDYVSFCDVTSFRYEEEKRN